MTGVREMHQSHTLLWVLRNNNEIKCSKEERLIMKRMKNFKKVAVSLMAAVMCFGMAGCNKTTGGAYRRCIFTCFFRDIIGY